MIRQLDTRELGPIRIKVEPAVSFEARRLLARAIRRRGPAWRNTADSVEAGGYGNVWTEAALAAIEEALTGQE